MSLSLSLSLSLCLVYKYTCGEISTWRQLRNKTWFDGHNIFLICYILEVRDYYKWSWQCCLVMSLFCQHGTMHRMHHIFVTNWRRLELESRTWLFFLLVQPTLRLLPCGLLHRRTLYGRSRFDSLERSISFQKYEYSNKIYNFSYHVIFIPRPIAASFHNPIADGGDGLQMWWVAEMYWIGSHVQRTRGGSPAFGGKRRPNNFLL